MPTFVEEKLQELDVLAKSRPMSRYLVIKIVNGEYSVIHATGDLHQAKQVTADCRKHCGEWSAKLVVNPYNPLNGLAYQQPWHRPENIEEDITRMLS